MTAADRLIECVGMYSLTSTDYAAIEQIVRRMVEFASYQAALGGHETVDELEALQRQLWDADASKPAPGPSERSRPARQHKQAHGVSTLAQAPVDAPLAQNHMQLAGPLPMAAPSAAPRNAEDTNRGPGAALPVRYPPRSRFAAHLPPSQPVALVIDGAADESAPPLPATRPGTSDPKPADRGLGSAAQDARSSNIWRTSQAGAMACVAEARPGSQQTCTSGGTVDISLGASAVGFIGGRLRMSSPAAAKGITSRPRQAGAQRGSVSASGESRLAEGCAAGPPACVGPMLTTGVGPNSLCLSAQARGMPKTAAACDVHERVRSVRTGGSGRARQVPVCITSVPCSVISQCGIAGESGAPACVVQPRSRHSAPVCGTRSQLREPQAKLSRPTSFVRPVSRTQSDSTALAHVKASGTACFAGRPAGQPACSTEVQGHPRPAALPSRPASSKLHDLASRTVNEHDTSPGSSARRSSVCSQSAEWSTGYLLQGLPAAGGTRAKRRAAKPTSNVLRALSGDFSGNEALQARLQVLVKAQAETVLLENRRLRGRVRGR